jgi:hypothetical protein
MKTNIKPNHNLKNPDFVPYETYEQEEILTRFGREARYQVFALDEDMKPSRFVGVENSPVNMYALVDRKYEGYTILEAVEAETHDEAYELLKKLITYPEPDFSE